jgi:hypothetical protein
VQELAALWRLEAGVLNGGFLRFFCNRDTDDLPLRRRTVHGIEEPPRLRRFEP